MARLFLILSLIPGAACAQPTADFFVAPNGNDAWTGRLPAPNAAGTDGPFATPARAREAARALRRGAGNDRPVTVLLRGGRYELREPLRFTPEDSGTARAPLVFAAYPGETPILSGGTAMPVRVEAGEWHVTVPAMAEPLRHITVGSRLRLPSRNPTTGTYTIAGLAGADPKANYRTAADRFNYQGDQINPNWTNINDIEVVVMHFWVAGQYRIKSIDSAQKMVTLDRKSIRRFTETHAPKPARFYLLNVPGNLTPGTFHHDRRAGKVRYRPVADETPAKSPVVVPRLTSIVQFVGRPEAGKTVEHIELRGLTLSDTVFPLSDQSAGDLQAADHVRGSVHLRGARHCVIAESRLKNLGGYGIELAHGCRSNRITGNELFDLAAGGIRLSGGAAGSPETLRTGENILTDNHLHDLGHVFHAGIGILSQHSDRNTIRHNHIHHLYYTGISVGWVWGYAASVSSGNLVEANRIHVVGRGLLSDMGGIYMLGVSPGTVVRGNVIHDVESYGYGGWGIYTDEGSTGITIENNLVYRTKSGGFHQHYGRENVIRNNIFALAREAQLMRTRPEPHLSFTIEGNLVYSNGAPLFGSNWSGDRFRIDRNLYWDASNAAPKFPGGTLQDWQARGHDRHSRIADPMFRDPAHGDFRLRDGSPATQMGFKPVDHATAGPRPPGARSEK